MRRHGNSPVVSSFQMRESRASDGPGDTSLERGQAARLTPAVGLQSLYYCCHDCSSDCPSPICVVTYRNANTWRESPVILTCFCLPRHSHLPAYPGCLPVLFPFRFLLLLQADHSQHQLTTAIKHFLAAGIFLGILRVSPIPMILLSPLKASKLKYTAWFVHITG